MYDTIDLINSTPELKRWELEWVFINLKIIWCMSVFNYYLFGRPWVYLEQLILKGLLVLEEKGLTQWGDFSFRNSILLSSLPSIQIHSAFCAQWSCMMLQYCYATYSYLLLFPLRHTYNINLILAIVCLHISPFYTPVRSGSIYLWNSVVTVNCCERYYIDITTLEELFLRLAA